MEFLSHAIIREVGEGQWKPVMLSRNGPPLSHLFFVDVVLIFVKVYNSQKWTIYNILNRFAIFFGLKVNIAKSKLFFFAIIR